MSDEHRKTDCWLVVSQRELFSYYLQVDNVYGWDIASLFSEPYFSFYESTELSGIKSSTHYTAEHLKQK